MKAGRQARRAGSRERFGARLLLAQRNFGVTQKGSACSKLQRNSKKLREAERRREEERGAERELRESARFSPRRRGIDLRLAQPRDEEALVPVVGVQVVRAAPPAPADGQRTVRLLRRADAQQRLGGGAAVVAPAIVRDVGAVRIEPRP